MANSLSNTALTFTRSLFQPEKQCSLSVLTQKFQPASPRILDQLSTRRLTPPPAVSKTKEALSSIIHELEREESTAKNKQRNERELADCWSEMLGEDDWAGLLDPMDPLLRNELIRYGVMAQACYDAFDFDPYSKYCGSCRFTRREFFERLGMAEAGYDITRYLYATSNINLPNFFKNSRWPKVWSKNANWIGYIAVSNDETSKKLGRRDICVAWRGTVTRLEWVADLMDFLRPISSDKIPSPDPTVRVESGFLDLYTDKDESCKYCKFSAREQILTEVNRLINEVYPKEEVSVTITGHSLGGASALLSAYDIVETGINVRGDSRAVPVCVFTFAGPRVGNARFKARLELLGVKVLRVVNVHDVVPKSPGLLVNEKAHPLVIKMAENFPWSYVHVGVELALDHKNSPFLRHDGDLVCAHNLEAHLHLLDGYHGRGERFRLNGRDYALVNKDCDFLKDEFEIPPNWRQDHNKGMVKNKEGRWVQQERAVHDDHPADMHHHLNKLGLPSNNI
ncbi:phospholipase A1-Igamma2, chloroplastic isoform X1 [Sesamum indicum]|uniref:Phospholipase A1-Igamma2, chloroplastic isoform X1 n=1 Tax=Sesamum indicum TaxID=4182 RepID=A0A6I9T735_SESIN|nr:phospholipase A1-Igamma2, chloroplastic isoform X1 [Sesamum indicum]